MTRRTLKRRTNQFIDKWVAWLGRDDESWMSGNPLWYPTSTVEARIMDGTAGVQSGSSGSKVPTNMKSGPDKPGADVLAVDRAMSEMPLDMAIAIKCSRSAYGKSAQYELFAEMTGYSQANYYNLQREGIMFVAGRLNLIV